MAETFATASYKERFIGSLNLMQSLIILCLVALGVGLAVHNAPPVILLLYGLFFLACYGGLAYYDIDEVIHVYLKYILEKKRFCWTSRQLTEFIGIKSFRGDLVETQDERLLAVLKVFPRDIGGLADDDLNLLLAGYKIFLNELSANIQIVMSSRETDIEGYISSLRNKVLLSENKAKHAFFNDFCGYLRGCASSKAVSDRCYHIVIPQNIGDNAEKACDLLRVKTKNIISSLTNAQIECTPLTHDDLIVFYGSVYNPCFSLEENMFCPISFENNFEEMQYAYDKLRDFCDLRDPVFERLNELSGFNVAGGGKEFVDVNNDLVDLIKPSLVEINSKYAVIEKYHCILYAIRFPSTVNPGWLTKLIRQPIDLDIVFHIHPISQKASGDYLSKEIMKLETDVTCREREGQLVPQKDRVTLSRVRELLERVSRDEEKCFDMALYVNVKGYSVKQLDEEVQRVKDVLDGMGVCVKKSVWDVKDALKSCYPIARDVLGAKRDRLFPASAVCASYPFILSCLENGGGQSQVAGINQFNGMPVLLDVFSQPNPHILVLGSSGSGKSFQVKKLLVNMNLSGVDIFIVDPQGEYGDLVESFGGSTISFGGENNNSLNIFSIDSDTYESRKNSVKALFNIISKSEISGSHGIVDRMIDASYQSLGIYPDDPTTHNKCPPTFDTVYESLNSLCKMESTPDYKRVEAEKLMTLITPLIEGPLKYLNKQTSIPPVQGGAVCFDISKACVGGGLSKAVALFCAFDFITKISAKYGSKRRKVIVVDEAWTAFENNQDYISPIIRCGRKENLAMILIDQNVEDLFNETSDGGVAGHVILNNTATKFIHRVETAGLKHLIEKFSLNSAQIDFIKNARCGDALMITPHLKLPLYIPATEKEKILFSTTPDEKKPISQMEINYSLETDEVLPAECLNPKKHLMAKELGYIEVISSGIARSEKKIYLVKTRQNETPEKTIKIHLTKRYIEKIAKNIKITVRPFQEVDIICEKNDAKTAIKFLEKTENPKKMENLNYHLLQFGENAIPNTEIRKKLKEALS